jgi:hypothetical protein
MAVNSANTGFGSNRTADDDEIPALTPLSRVSSSGGAMTATWTDCGWYPLSAKLMTKSRLAEMGKAHGVRHDPPVEDFASAPGGSDSMLIVPLAPPPEKLGIDMLGIHEDGADQLGDQDEDEQPASATPHAKSAITLLDMILVPCKTSPLQMC